MISDEAREAARKDTLAHIDKVRSLLLMMTSLLFARGRNHDASKLEEPELSLFAEWGPKLKTMEYGSDEYKAALDQMGVALQHHYQNNRHHPEHHGDAGVGGMNLVDIMEMVCDWHASSLRTKDGDFMASLEHNRKRFNLSPQLVRIIANTAKLFEEDGQIQRLEGKLAKHDFAESDPFYGDHFERMQACHGCRHSAAGLCSYHAKHGWPEEQGES